MKLRTRIITLLAVTIIGTALAPVGAQAGRASNPATAPFSQPMKQAFCSTTGTGTCTSEATVNVGGRLTGASTTYVRDDSTNGVTDTSEAFSRAGVSVSFSLPKAGASSVTFTVDTLINSATASRSNPAQSAFADVYFFAYASGSWNNCTSCTVIFDHYIADSDEGTLVPASRSNENETFSFVLKSKAGDPLTGRVDVRLWLTERVRITESDTSGGLLPTLGASPAPIEGTAEGKGDAVLKSVSATFNP